MATQILLALLIFMAALVVISVSNLIVGVIFLAAVFVILYYYNKWRARSPAKWQTSNKSY